MVLVSISLVGLLINLRLPADLFKTSRAAREKKQFQKHIREEIRKLDPHHAMLTSDGQRIAIKYFDSHCEGKTWRRSFIALNVWVNVLKVFFSLSPEPSVILIPNFLGSLVVLLDLHRAPATTDKRVNLLLKYQMVIPVFSAFLGLRVTENNDGPWVEVWALVVLLLIEPASVLHYWYVSWHERMFVALGAFVTREKHSNVPPTHVEGGDGGKADDKGVLHRARSAIGCGDDGEGGEKLGAWLARQLKLHEADALPPVRDLRLQQEHGVNWEHLKQLVQSCGEEVPASKLGKISLRIEAFFLKCCGKVGRRTHRRLRNAQDGRDHAREALGAAAGPRSVSPPASAAPAWARTARRRRRGHPPRHASPPRRPRPRLRA